MSKIIIPRHRIHVASNPLPPLSEHDIKRFWDRVDKSPGFGPKGDCWKWMGGAFTGGYGALNVILEDGRRVVLRATRIACFLQNGIDPHPYHALHSCDWPQCVRHVRPGTQQENASDKAMRHPRKDDHYWPAPKVLARHIETDAGPLPESVPAIAGMNQHFEALFWRHVQKGAIEQCWPWTGGLTRNGYGVFCFYPNGSKGKPSKWLAHRLSWTLMRGPIPNGLQLLHDCDNKICCNSARHHFLGTQADNVEHALRHGLFERGNKTWRKSYPGSVRRGEKHWSSKISDSELMRMHRLRQQGKTLTDLTEEFKLSRAQVSRILSGVQRKDLYDSFYSQLEP